ncbi:g5683 [Coccomyxa viridis]|uniref:G5683 protein n=1 Tax=Coccomyxa viridis TaxID=1274662 RepID=A0ABP1FTH7_9CHLO
MQHEPSQAEANSTPPKAHPAHPANVPPEKDAVTTNSSAEEDYDEDDLCIVCWKSCGMSSSTTACICVPARAVPETSWQRDPSVLCAAPASEALSQSDFELFMTDLCVIAILLSSPCATVVPILVSLSMNE